MKDNVDVEPNKDDLPGDTFDATVIELDVGDFLNRSTPVLSREPKLANWKFADVSWLVGKCCCMNVNWNTPWCGVSDENLGLHWPTYAK